MRAHRSIYIVALLTLAAPWRAASAQMHPDTLTLAGAVALAEARHPALAAAAGRARTAVGRARQEAAFANPTLEWRGEQLNADVPSDEFLTVALPLDVTGKRLAWRGAVRATRVQAAADSVAVLRQVQADAARAYWRVVLARELLAAQVEQARAATELARFETERAAAGEVAEVSALRAGLARDQARLATAAAHAEWQRAQAALAQAVGVSAESLAAPAPMATVRRVAADETTLEPAAAESLAVARRPELVALRAAVEGARRRVDATRRAALPDVTITAGQQRTAGVGSQLLGVAVPLPLFDRNDGAREAALGELRAAEAELRQAELAVRAEAAAAAASHAVLLAAGPQAGDELDARGGEVARILEAAHREGGISLLEVLEAQRARAEARTVALRWAVDVRLQRVELNLVTGAPILEGLETP